MAMPEREGLRRPESVADFIGELRGLKAVAGLSLRELQRRTGLPRSTIAHALRTDRPTLPPWDRVLALLRALGVAETALPAWKQAWTGLRLAADAGARARVEGRSKGSDATPVAAEGTPAGCDGAAVQADRAAADGDFAGGGSGAVEGVTAPVRGFRRGPSRQRVLTHAASLLLGVCIGVGAMEGLAGVDTAGSPAGVKVGYPVEEQPCPSPTADPAPDPAGVADAGPRTGNESAAWVARAAADQQVLGGTDVVLPVTNAVTAGNALVVTMMLTATCPGPLTVTDTQGNTFRIVAEETDGRLHRTLVLAAFHVRPLSTADSIRVTYPHASKYHVAVDEFSGISRAVGYARAHGESGQTAFSTSSTRLDCAAGDLVVGTVGSNSGTAPAFTGEWTALPVLRLSSYRLSTAYRIVPAAQMCAVTGTTTSQWAAAAVVFR
ncbi:helix-turn-helix domain-containing protein [Streptomyces sp. NPDC058279]|uniref:helix-turn-helix domain-containing protein n=1 Tax=Streptomyces sp. NPDC058279 TaxID=3346418 RepID=UPI0036E49278